MQKYDTAYKYMISMYTILRIYRLEEQYYDTDT